MRPGSKRAVWLFLLLGALSGAYAVPAPRLVPGVRIEICAPDARIAEPKRDALPVASSSAPLAEFPHQADPFVRYAVPCALYRRPPPFLFQR